MTGPEKGHETWPLSHTQRNFAQRFAEDGAGPANLALGLHIEDLSVSAVRDGLRAVASRQDLLRASFTGKALRIAAEPRTEPVLHGLVAESDVSSLLEKQSTVVRHHDEDLWSAHVFDLPDGRKVIGFVFHHLIFDGLSAPTFLGQLRDGDPWSAAPARTYRDFVTWQQERFDHPEAHQEFWRRHLRGRAHNQHTSIRFARNLEEPLVGPSEEVAVRIAGRSLRRVIAASRSLRVSVFQTVMSALTIALADVTDDDDAVVRVAFHGRPVGFESTLGSFAHDVTVRLPTTRTSLSAVVPEVAATWDGLGDHRFTPYRVVRDAVGATDLPFRPVVVTLNSGRLPERTTFLGRPAEPVFVPAGIAEEGLHIALGQHRNALEMVCSFHPTRFVRSDIEALMADLVEVMQHI